MILPTTYGTALMLTILTMLCWGSWANTFKVTKEWRFELFYFDYSFGVLIAAIVAAFTFGSMGDELSFQDNLLIAGRHFMIYGVLAGVVFNLANMLLVAAISLAGMAVAFPIGIGLAMVIGVIWNYIINPQGNPFLIFAGTVLVIGAIIVDAMAYRAHSVIDGEVSEDFSLKGVVIALVSGVLMGSFYPLVELSRSGDVGLGPYSVAFFFGIGVFFSTFIFNLYFMNLPVEGEPVGFPEYFTGRFGNHVWGILGGIIWCVGAICNFVAASGSAKVGPAVSYGLGQGATMVSAFWGIFVWKEFAGSEGRVKLLLAIMFVLFIGGLTLISMAPLYGTK